VLSKQAEYIEYLFDSIKFPTDINYCDWERLDKSEKERLWTEYLTENNKTTKMENI